jgi:hypothetical protein
VIFRDRDLWNYAVDPRGRFLVICSESGVRKVAFDGAESVTLSGIPRFTALLPIDPTGRFLASLHPSGLRVLVLDLETGQRHEVEPPGEGECRDGAIHFTRAGQLMITRGGVVSLWDPASRQTRIVARIEGRFALPIGDGRRVLFVEPDTKVRNLLDLDTGARTRLTHLHEQVVDAALDRSGSLLVTGHLDGSVFVGRLLDQRRHLLLAHDTGPPRVKVWMSPDGRWIASLGSEGTLLLWPMPDLDRPPLHTLPYDQLMSRLESLTNLRAVPDEQSPTGYSIEPDLGAYRGWAEVPEW